MAEMPRRIEVDPNVASAEENEEAERLQAARDIALKVEMFFLKNPDKEGFVMGHGWPEILEGIQQGKCFIIEDDKTEDIVAVSMVWRTFAGNVEYMEAGGMRSIMWGYNFQVIMHFIRYFMVALPREQYEPDSGPYITAHYANNAKSASSLSGDMYEVWEKPDEALVEKRALQIAGSKNAEAGVSYYKVGRSTKHHMLAKMLDKDLDPLFRDGTVTYDRSERAMKARELVGASGQCVYNMPYYDRIELRLEPELYTALTNFMTKILDEPFEQR